ncbi:helix-turn-helix domain-containing protein [Mucilaginibacter phyllosphaerae]
MIESTEANTHIGQNISHIRHLVGVKQETMAKALHISQPEYSRIERSLEIEEKLLNDIAEILGVKSDVIKNFNPSRVPGVVNNAQYIIYGNHTTESATNVIINSPDLYEMLLNKLLETQKELEELGKKLKVND